MGVHLTPAEGRALYALLAETTTDIVLKTDRRGFIVHATPAIERLGFAIPAMLFGPHLAELALPSHAERLRIELDQAIAGRPSGHWVEFPARMADARKARFEIQLSALTDDLAGTYGALGIMRSVEERRLLEEQLFAVAMTDPLTRLTNRQAFLAMLGHLVECGRGGSLALFSIDHFKAVNLRYGQATGDAVLIAFADLLRALLRPDDIISRIGNQRFGVLLPHAGPDRAAEVCRRIVETLSGLGATRSVDGLPVTASAGVAAIGGSLDATMKRVELALFFARAKGRNRIEVDCGEALPRAA